MADRKTPTKLDTLDDEILSKIFGEVVGHPIDCDQFVWEYPHPHPCDPELILFGDRQGATRTINPEYKMIFVLPKVCRRWREIVKRSENLFSNVSLSFDLEKNITTPPHTWWIRHASKMNSVHLALPLPRQSLPDDLQTKFLSLLSDQRLRTLYLQYTLKDFNIFSWIIHLRQLRQLQLHAVDRHFFNNINMLTNFTCLKVLEFGGFRTGDDDDIALKPLALENFPQSLEKLSVVNVSVNLESVTEGRLMNLHSFHLSFCPVFGDLCGYLERFPSLKNLTLHDLYFCNEQNRHLTTLSTMNNLTDVKFQICKKEPIDDDFFEYSIVEFTKNPPPNGFRFLKLSSTGMHLKNVAHFDRYQDLRVLVINGILLNAIPDSILKLTRLEKLYIVHCRVSTVPDIVPCFARSIRYFDLSGNNLSALPMVLRKWTGLEDVILSDNPIKGRNSICSGPDHTICSIPMIRFIPSFAPETDQAHGRKKDSYIRIRLGPNIFFPLFF